MPVNSKGFTLVDTVVSAVVLGVMVISVAAMMLKMGSGMLVNKQKKELIIAVEDMLADMRKAAKVMEGDPKTYIFPCYYNFLNEGTATINAANEIDNFQINSEPIDYAYYSNGERKVKNLLKTVSVKYDYAGGFAVVDILLADAKSPDIKAKASAKIHKTIVGDMREVKDKCALICTVTFNDYPTATVPSGKLIVASEKPNTGFAQQSFAWGSSGQFSTGKVIPVAEVPYKLTFMPDNPTADKYWYSIVTLGSCNIPATYVNVSLDKVGRGKLKLIVVDSSDPNIRLKDINVDFSYTDTEGSIPFVVSGKTDSNGEVVLENFYVPYPQRAQTSWGYPLGFTSNIVDEDKFYYSEVIPSDIVINDESINTAVNQRTIQLTKKKMIFFGLHITKPGGVNVLDDGDFKVVEPQDAEPKSIGVSFLSNPYCEAVKVNPTAVSNNLQYAYASPSGNVVIYKGELPKGSLDTFDFTLNVGVVKYTGYNDYKFSEKPINNQQLSTVLTSDIMLGNYANCKIFNVAFTADAGDIELKCWVKDTFGNQIEINDAEIFADPTSVTKIILPYNYDNSVVNIKHFGLVMPDAASTTQFDSYKFHPDSNSDQFAITRPAWYNLQPDPPYFYGSGLPFSSYVVHNWVNSDNLSKRARKMIIKTPSANGGGLIQFCAFVDNPQNAGDFVLEYIGQTGDVRTKQYTFSVDGDNAYKYYIITDFVNKTSSMQANQTFTFSVQTHRFDWNGANQQDYTAHSDVWHRWGFLGNNNYAEIIGYGGTNQSQCTIKTKNYNSASDITTFYVAERSFYVKKNNSADWDTINARRYYYRTLQVKLLKTATNPNAPTFTFNPASPQGLNVGQTKTITASVSSAYTNPEWVNLTNTLAHFTTNRFNQTVTVAADAQGTCKLKFWCKVGGVLYDSPVYTINISGSGGAMP